MPPSSKLRSLAGSFLVLALYVLGTGAIVTLLGGAPGFDPGTGFGVSRLWFIALALAQYLGILLGVGLVYHRILVHRAGKMHPVLAYPLVAWVLPAGTPVQWVGNHRHHHRTTDRPDDAHSPVQHGFWVAHAGWYIGRTEPLLCALYGLAGPFRILFDAFWRPRTNQEHIHMSRDIAEDPFYAFISQPLPYAALMFGHLALSWLVAYALFGVWALPLVYLQQTSYFLFGDAVNSILHMYGDQHWESGDCSRDHALLAALTFGEGWHNGHHAFPNSIRAGLMPGQVDMLYLIARGLERVGLMSDLRLPEPGELEGRLRNTTET